MRVATIIVNYRTPELTLDCLRSLAPELEPRPSDAVIVLDGASGDGSEERLREGIQTLDFAGRCDFLPLPENRGFAYANNAALRRIADVFGATDYCFLLNPDTIVRPGALDALVEFASAHPKAAIVGSRCENPDGSARASAFRFHSILGELVSTAQLGMVSSALRAHHPVVTATGDPLRVDWVSGAAMLIRTDLFRSLGGLDDGYFLYYEETDLARRVAEAGFECWHVPTSRVVHLCGQSSGVTGTAARQQRRPKYWFQSRHRYFVKHHGRGYAMAADLAWLLGSSAHAAACWLRKREATTPPHLKRDFLRYSAELWSTRP